MRIDKIIRFYKAYISPLNPPSCRYYPTCSQYAKDCFRFNNAFVALFKSVFRILKCNQLFAGGVEYPTANISNLSPKLGVKINIDFYLVPIKNNKFYIIQSLKDSK